MNLYSFNFSYWLALAILGGVLINTSTAQAAEGVFEINQTCAITGCFSFDSPGFPVIVNSALDSPRLILTSDLDLRGLPSAENLTAIAIFGDGTVLDLNGFSIIGPGVVGTGRGVSASGADGVSVINGKVIGMGDRGVYVGDSARVENMTVIENGNYGIAAPQDAHVSGCIVWNNGADGMIIASGTVEQSVVANNAGYGINANSGTVVINNSIGFNAAGGIRASPGNQIRANAVRGNSGFDLDLTFGTNSFSENVLGSLGGGGIVETGPNLCGGNLTCP
ncbi:MAG: right-handed parallel beta-helix repeat-containing protein [Myxococcota bacterium]